MRNLFFRRLLFYNFRVTVQNREQRLEKRDNDE